MLAGTAGLLCPYPRVAAAEPPPEVTQLRLITQPGSICVAPKYVAEALLQAEGFIDIHYAEEPQYSARMQRLAAGETDLEFTFVGPLITGIDAGTRLWSWREDTSAALSCSAPSRSAPSAT
jgi:hypothetical protein